MKEAINLYFQEQRENAFYSSVTQSINEAASHEQQAAEERNRLLSNVLDAQKKWNDLMEKRNESLNKIKDSVNDLNRKLNG